jgi:hypothetical protein
MSVPRALDVLATGGLAILAPVDETQTETVVPEEPSGRRRFLDVIASGGLDLLAEPPQAQRAEASN